MPASTSRERYVQQAVDDALRGAVLWQLREMHVGLKLALDPTLLEEWAVTATDLAAMVGGADEAAADGPVAVRDVSSRRHAILPHATPPHSTSVVAVSPLPPFVRARS